MSRMIGDNNSDEAAKKEKYRTKFDEFLQRHEVGKGQATNYTNMNPFRSYMITDDDDYNKFIKLYTKCALYGISYSITQKHKKINYFILDVDWKFPIILGEQRVYTYDDIIDIVSLCNRNILKYVHVPNKKLIAFVMEKKKPHVRKGYSCDGLHIVYPCFGFHTDIHYLIIDSIIREIEEKKLLGTLAFLNPLKDVFDTNVVYNANWMLYGSFKPGSSVYIITHIFNHELEEIQLCDVKDVYDFCTEDETKSFKNKKRREMNLCLQVILPKFLSVRKFDKETVKLVNNLTMKHIEDQLAELKNTTKKKKTIIHIEKKSESITLKNYFSDKPIIRVVTKGHLQDVSRAQKLIKILSKSRASNYKEWINVGIALHNIDYVLLETWIEFSKSCSDKFEPGECQKLWDKFDKYGYSMGTLMMWAKQDNPKKYIEFKKEEIKDSLIKGMSSTSYDLAIVIHNMYKGEFVCASIDSKDWYQYKGHRWKHIQGGYVLDLLLSQEVVDEYEKLRGYYVLKEKDEKDEELKKQHGARIKVCEKLISNLKNTRFKNGIMEECRKVFYDPNFYEKLDENRDLIGFENGVYDLARNEFRGGVPDDCITFSTQKNYIPYDPNDIKIKWVTSFIKQIQPKKEMRDYVIKLLASFLQGHNPEEKFYIWTGSGCFLINTLVMMANGTVKYIQDIKVNNQVMGVDMKPKKVSTILRGKGEMYNIIPCINNKTELESYTVNFDHKLALRASQTFISWNANIVTWWEWKNQTEFKQDNIDHLLARPVKYSVSLTGKYDKILIEQKLLASKYLIKKHDGLLITVRDWLTLLKTHKELSDMFLGYRVPIEFDDCDDLDIDPYLLGVWIVFGSPHARKLIGINNKIKDILFVQHIIDDKGEFIEHVKVNMKKMKMFDSKKGKRIPFQYLCSSCNIRKEIIRGLNDSGVINTFVCSNKNLVDDIRRLYDTVGYVTTCRGTKSNEYSCSNWMINIYCADETKLKIKNCNQVRDYYGIELAEYDSRYLLHDGTVVSNSNGKSKLITLFQLAFGDYYDTLPTTLLTKKRGSSNAATPELAKTKGKRFCVIQEPEDEDKIYVGLMKELSGNDVIEARKLYKEPIKFRPQFKLVLTCNKLPNMSAVDYGTWRRVRLIEFTSQFLENPDPNKPNQFKIDKEMNKKIPLYAEAFMSLLIEYYKKYQEEGLIEPAEVKLSTDKYRESSDMYFEFIKENLIDTNKKDKISYTVLYSIFKSWIRNMGSKSGTPPRKDLLDYLEKHNYDLNDGHLLGWAVKTNNVEKKIDLDGE